MNETIFSALAGVRPTTHNPQPTTHNPQPTTHNPQPTTHNPQPGSAHKKDHSAAGGKSCLSLASTGTCGGGQISERHLQRLFKAEKECCPLSYLRRLRLERACELLRTTDDSIGAIAASVGINDFSHFVRDFSHAQGVSPTEYRKGSAE